MAAGAPKKPGPKPGTPRKPHPEGCACRVCAQGRGQNTTVLTVRLTLEEAAWVREQPPGYLARLVRGALRSALGPQE